MLSYLCISSKGFFEIFFLQEWESVNDFLSEKESLDIEGAELQHYLSIHSLVMTDYEHKRHIDILCI